MPHHGQIEPVEATSSTVVVNDANLTLAQRVFQAHIAPPAAATSTPAVVQNDEAGLVLAQRAYQFHQQQAATSTAAVVVNESNLILAGQTHARHIAPLPSPPADMTSILATQIFGA